MKNVLEAADAMNQLLVERHKAKSIVLRAEAGVADALAHATDIERRIQLATIEYDRLVRLERAATVPAPAPKTTGACHCARCSAERAAVN